jgi:hypothetical protein
MQHNIDLARRLHTAVCSLNVSEVKSMLDQGAPPSLLLNNTTALHLAVQIQSTAEKNKKALHILDMLLEKGDINQFAASRTVMNLAAHNNYWDAVLLIAKKKKTDNHDKAQYGSALLDAVRFCRSSELLQELVHELLEAGAIDNTSSHSNGFTSLHWAIDNNNSFILRLLLAKFPNNCLRLGGGSGREKRWDKDKSPARMAFDEKKMTCLMEIAVVAYLPIIKGELAVILPHFVDEKDIIYKFVCSLSTKDKWEAINHGLDKLHPLGALNYIKTGLIVPSIESGTLKLYFEEKAVMEKQGILELRQSPQLFQSAPRGIPSVTTSIPSRSTASGKLQVGTPEWIISDYRGRVSPAAQTAEPASRVHSASPADYFARLFEPSPPDYSAHTHAAVEPDIKRFDA